MKDDLLRTSGPAGGINISDWVLHRTQHDLTAASIGGTSREIRRDSDRRTRLHQKREKQTSELRGGTAKTTKGFAS